MNRLTSKSPMGRTGVEIPPVVFGTSCLGNLYCALPDDTKLNIMREMFERVEAPVVLDSAGKYGAGLALEVIGRGLAELGVSRDDVLISNKLAWIRTPLTTAEPTFEPGVWDGLEHDAVQKISYRGIMECWEQGCELLGGTYTPRVVSVHDPDEYLGAATCRSERQDRMGDIVEAYRALHDLKQRGEAKAVGVGAKDWHVIRELAAETDLDWVMLACSLTVMHHPPELLAFIEELTGKGVSIINSAVFHAGFLTGGAFYDYRKVSAADPADALLFSWRERFFELCKQFDVVPAEACVQFGMTIPGVISTALNTSKPERIADNVRAVRAEIPGEFWHAMKAAGLIASGFPYV